MREYTRLRENWPSWLSIPLLVEMHTGARIVTASNVESLQNLGQPLVTEQNLRALGAAHNFTHIVFMRPHPICFFTFNALDPAAKRQWLHKHAEYCLNFSALHPVDSLLTATGVQLSGSDVPEAILLASRALLALMEASQATLQGVLVVNSWAYTSTVLNKIVEYTNSHISGFSASLNKVSGYELYPLVSRYYAGPCSHPDCNPHTTLGHQSASRVSICYRRDGHRCP